MFPVVDGDNGKIRDFFGDCFGRNAAGFFLKKTKRNRDYFVNPAIYHKGVLNGVPVVARGWSFVVPFVCTEF